MTGPERIAILEETIGRITEPRIAQKLYVMFHHLADGDDGDMSEMMFRNFIMTAVQLIDRYTLINGEFTESQRALLAAETLEIWQDKNTKGTQ